MGATPALHRISDGAPQRRSVRQRLEDWPILLLGAALVGAFVFQMFVLRHRAVEFGVSAQALREGRWWTLVTSMFIHAGLYHLLMNVSALSIGGPVYRRLGRGLKGTLLLYGLYLVCGLAGGLTYIALNPQGTTPAVGASGAIFGLWGALARIGAGDGGIDPLFSAAVGRHVWQAVKQNLILIAILFGLSLLSRGATLKLAWEAHAGGFLAGLLLIAPLLRMAGISTEPMAGEPTVVEEG